jgi:hypothetical protein
MMMASKIGLTTEQMPSRSQKASPPACAEEANPSTIISAPARRPDLASAEAAEMIDPLAEYLDLMRQTSLEAVEQLHTKFHIPWTAIAATCPAPTRVAFSDLSQRFCRPDPDGMQAWVLPVCCVDPAQPEEIEATDPLGVVVGGHVVDLVAFDPERPRRIVRRTGLGTVLGAVEPQLLDPEPVPIWRDDSDWLRAGCNGVVLLTDDIFEKGRILRRISAVKAEDPEHAQQLKAWIELPEYPRIFSTRVYAMRRAA